MAEKIVKDSQGLAKDLVNDCISRQAAIDLLKQMRKDGDMIPWEGKDVFARIRKLPPAQPEIIRCRDCKHYYFADNRIPQEQRYVCDIGGEVWQPDDYCSYAERREVANEAR